MEEFVSKEGYERGKEKGREFPEKWNRKCFEKNADSSSDCHIVFKCMNCGDKTRVVS